MAYSVACRSLASQQRLFLYRRCCTVARTAEFRQRRQGQVSVLVALASAVTTSSVQKQHPMSTLAETDGSGHSKGPFTASTSNTTTTSTSQRHLHHTTTAKQHHHNHFYGSPLVPQDIYFNEVVRESLVTMRRQHATQAAVARNESLSTAAASERDNADDDDDKALSVLGRSGHRNAATLTLIGYKGGYADDQINQDRAVVISPFRQDENGGTTIATQESCFLGVFDGHGPLGENVAEYSVSQLPRLVSRKLSKTLGRSTAESIKEVNNVKQILVDSFIEIDQKAPAEKSGGCTASVVMQLGNKLFVANAGDSRSFIVCYRKRTKVASIVYISREDKPHLPEEKARLEKMGGQVAMPTIFGATSRVYYTNPKSGCVSGLAMSRSIGDRAAGKMGVIPDPIVDVVDIQQLVESTRNNTLGLPSFVVIDGYRSSKDATKDNIDDVHIFAASATDGLMDYLSVEAIAATLAHSLFEDDGPHLLTACEALIKAAAAGWHTVHQGRYRDDIAIAVSRIRIPPK